MSKNRLIFFGNERLASGVTTTAPVLRSLIDSGYDIAAVVVNQGEVRGRRQRQLEVEAVATEHNIPLWCPERVGDIADDITASGAVCGVLAAYGRLVPESIINLFPHGIVNIHPSPLPHWRGSTPIESVILSGQESTGVSLMQLVKDMDAGPVYGFAELPLSGNESKQQLAEQLAELGAHLLTELLPGILDGSLGTAEQDHQDATYCSTITKENGTIDWNEPAETIERKVRAYYGWPGSTTTLGDLPVTVTQASVLNESGTPGQLFRWRKSLAVYCGQDALLIEKLKPAGKAEMDSPSFLNGYAQAIGL